MSSLELQAAHAISIRDGRSLQSPIVQVFHQETEDRVLHGAFVRLERSAVKVACSVLRGLGEGDLAWLPGGATREESL